MNIDSRTLSQAAISHLEVLLGQSRFSSMSEGFRQSTDNTSNLFMVALMVLGIVLVAWLASRYFRIKENRKYRCPKRLFRRLCRVHKLSLIEWWLLRSLAHRRHLASPAEVFVNPRLLEFEPGTQTAMTRQIENIREKLFGLPAND
jgi:hypothetical protein